MRNSNLGSVLKLIVGIAAVLLFVAVHAAVANDDLVAQTGKLRGVVKIEGEVPKVPPRKTQPKRLLAIPRNQDDPDRNQREGETFPVVEIPSNVVVDQCPQLVLPAPKVEQPILTAEEAAASSSRGPSRNPSPNKRTSSGNE